MIPRLNKSIIVLVVLYFLAGLTWGEEFCVRNATQLQDALTEAATNGEDDIIRVEQGTYKGNFIFDSSEGQSLTLLGGFAPGCDTWTLDPSKTILDGNNAGRVLHINNPGQYWGGDIHIRGFTIQNGKTDDMAGGIYAASCVMGFPGRITLEDNIIRDNSAPKGGGICAYTDDEDFGPLFADKMDVRIGRKEIIRSIPRRTRIRQYDEGDIAIINNRVENNMGGGIVAGTNADVIAGSIYIANNEITGNSGTGIITSTWGGGTEINGNMISGNTSLEKGGGIYSRTDGMGVSDDLSLINNTITGNLCSDSGGGVCLEWLSKLNLYNNIIWGNSAPAGGDVFMEIDPEFLFLIESHGFNKPYVFTLDYVSTFPSHIPPRSVYRAESYDWPETTGSLKHLSFSLNALARFKIFQALTLEMSGGLTYFTLKGEASCLGFTLLWMGGHETVGEWNYQLKFSFGPKGTFGGNLGLGVEIPVIRPFFVFAGVHAFFAPKIGSNRSLRNFSTKKRMSGSSTCYRISSQFRISSRL